MAVQFYSPPKYDSGYIKDLAKLNNICSCKFDYNKTSIVYPIDTLLYILYYDKSFDTSNKILIDEFVFKFKNKIKRVYFDEQKEEAIIELEGIKQNDNYYYEIPEDQLLFKCNSLGN